MKSVYKTFFKKMNSSISSITALKIMSSFFFLSRCIISNYVILSKDEDKEPEHLNFYIGYISDHVYDFIIVYANMKKIKISIDIPYIIVIKFILFLYCSLMCIENSLLSIAGLFSVCGVFVSSLLMDLENMNTKITTNILKSCTICDVIYEKECVVCLEELQQEDKLCRLSCKHVLHYDCMESYIEVSNKRVCPTCRTNICFN
jgi:hypothetical protein